jgi:hypothetical protein
MRNVKIYIGQDPLDMFGDESIQVTQTIQNTKDIGSVFSNFSTSFAVPASPNNNRIFEYYYNYQVVGFDARFKVEGRIDINGLTFDAGYFKLNSVDIKGGRPHTYNLTFFGELVNLKDIFGEDNLNQLDWSGYNQQYSQPSVASLMSNGVTIDGETNAMITPLITSAYEDYIMSSSTLVRIRDWRGLKYALKIKNILKAIERTYSISFVGDWILTDSRLEKLYMWLHREAGYTQVPQGEYDLLWDGIEQRVLWTQAPIYPAGNTTASGWNYYEWSAGPEQARSHEVDLTLNVTTQDAFTLVLYLNNQPIWQSTYSGATTYNISLGGGELFDEGNYFLRIQFANPITVVNTSSWSFTLNVMGESQAYDYSISDQIDQGAVAFGSTFVFNPADQIPEIKVLDFLTGLFKMFNLTAYKNVLGQIVLQTLDSFYSSGQVRDWSGYVDDRNMTISPLVLYNEMEFTYEGLESILADQHTKLAGKGWGTEQYASVNKYEGTKYVVKPPFEHMKFERTFYGNTLSNFMRGLMVDQNNATYIGKPLIFMAEQEAGTIDVESIFGDPAIRVENYFMPKNVLDSGESIHFSAEFDEYTNTIASDSLFKEYYEKYIVSVFDQQSRLYNLSGKLPISELIGYKLNDTIEINGTRYLINSVTTEVTSGKSEFELKNIV